MECLSWLGTLDKCSRTTASRLNNKTYSKSKKRFVVSKDGIYSQFTVKYIESTLKRPQLRRFSN